MIINPEDTTNILTGVFSLLSLFGLPVAAVGTAIGSIVTGIIGIRNSKEQAKKEKQQKETEQNDDTTDI